MKITNRFMEFLMKYLGQRLVHPINRRRVLYFAIPKSGSSSLRPVALAYGIEIHNHDLRDPKWRELHERSDLERKFCFTTIRNPIERTYSAWRYLSTGGNSGADAIDSKKWLIENESFNDFVLRNFGADDAPILLQIHFRPMVRWIENKRGELVVDAIFRLDEMEYLVNRFLPKILGCKLKYEGYKPSNVSKKKSEGDIPITPSALKLLELTYSEDIKLWNQVANRK